MGACMSAPLLPNSSAPEPVRCGWLVFVLLVVVPAAIYWNSLHVPFVLDDAPIVRENPSIRTLWPVTTPLSPPAGGLPISARPVANLSLALNYAMSGESGTSYHALNVGLHVLNALLLFGVLRRTLVSPVVTARIRASADDLALGIVALWAIHPLQTAAVTYLSQRTELLATFCYLLTLYAFIRAEKSQGRASRLDEPGLTLRSDARLVGTTRPTVAGWAALAFLACLAGMGSKETMASAPLIVLLYDRTFLAGTFAEAWRRRGRWHAALFATWLLLGWLVWHSASRGGTAGLGVDMSRGAYALTQGEAIMRYLLRAIWPHPLVFDYGDYLAPANAATIARSVFVAVLLIGTVVACSGLRFSVIGLRFGSGQTANSEPKTVNLLPAGFAGAVFFGVLAPSSSLVPVATQTIAEHRMYLPLAVVLTGVALGIHAWIGRRAWMLGVVVGLVAGGLVVARNGDYASVITLWRDTVAKRPENIRARNNLAAALLEARETAAGLAELHAAARLRPEHPDVLRNLAQAEFNAGNLADARAHLERAQQIDPTSAAGWLLLGTLRAQQAQPDLAANAYERAIALRPDLASAHLGLGDARMARGDYSAAIAAYSRVRELRPDVDEGLFGLAVALFQAERNEEALALFAQLVARRPDYPELQVNYGGALLEAGQFAAALREFDAALARGKPTPQLLHLRALALFQLDRRAEATQSVREVLRLAPDYAPARELARQLGL